ncbi:MAG: thrombospondin type 3 repeat-containing protein [Candidatus Thermoplasmatota archaeon]|nr:thrombospondin type 3 repeat-containing protein [Candidatus Thermoplasmatota archaeon]
MRPTLKVISATVLVALMFCSVSLPQVMSYENSNELSNDIISETSGRSVSTILASGSGAGYEDGEHIEPIPSGGWVIGSEYYETLTYGTHTLDPTVPASLAIQGAVEFYVALLDETGAWNGFVSADHSNGGYSYLTDVTIGAYEEIIVTGYFGGEITFGPQGSNIVISNFAPHLEGFVAVHDPFQGWLWAKNFSTLVNGTGEFSQATHSGVHPSGDIIVSGVFSGETDFGGYSINATSQDVFVAMLDAFSGTTLWVTSGGGVGADALDDMAITPNGEIKLATATGTISQWASFGYVAKGNVDAAIVELDEFGAVTSLEGIGTSGESTRVYQIEVDANGDTYLSGTFGGTIGSTGWSATATYGGNDIFIVRSSNTPANTWSFVSGSSLTDFPEALTVTSSGSVIFGGLMNDTFYAGTKSLLNQDIDGFLVGLSPSGSVSWIEKFGGSGQDTVFALATNSSDFVGATGSFSGSFTHKGVPLSSGGYRDVYAWIFDPANLIDTDADGVPDSSDNCPNISNPVQANTDGDQQGDACDGDDDNDGLSDNFPDNCPRNGEFNWTSARDFNDPVNSTDWDNDGCKDDTSEDLDDDNDGIVDVDDTCPLTAYTPPRPTWVSDSTTDVDGDGCRDSDEDIDDDNDGFEDAADDCPTVVGTSTLGTQGCIDTDGDLWSDSTDDCPTEFGNSTEGNLNACPDMDGDGWADSIDDLPMDPTVWSDSDDDGYGDNLGSEPADACPDIPGTSSLDRYGCVDADGDGYSTETQGWGIDSGADAFPSDSTQWADFDEDGFGDNYGNASWIDRPENWVGMYMDGAQDQDACPMQPGTSWQNGILGCPDSDGDGWWDVQDAFPGEASQWSDVDGDGYGDNSSGANADACPNRGGNSTIDRLGCIDSDGDGYSDAELSWTIEDGADDPMFRLEPTQWKDSDRDGFGDELDGFEGDQCPDVAGTSRLDRFGCPDSDGDGWSDPDENWTLEDGADAYINDPLTHIYVEPIVVENKEEENFFTSPVMLVVYCIAVLVLAGLAFVMTRGPKQPEMKQYNQMGMQQPAMQQQVTMPAAQANPYQQPVQTQTYAQAAAQPVVQPDPAMDYYNGLLSQGYTPEQASMFTKQYFPQFNH